MTSKDDAKGHEFIARVKENLAATKDLNNKVIELGMADKD
jgi:hypothetical protein